LYENKGFSLIEDFFARLKKIREWVKNKPLMG